MKNKKFLIIFLSIFTILLFIAGTCMADSGYITASSLNMRKSASTDSKVVTVLHNGTKVTIKGTSGSWYKVSYGGYTGYVSKNYVRKSSSSSSSSSSKSSSSSSSGSSAKVSTGSTLRKGCSGTNVKNLQKKLKQLGYYSGTVDGDYGTGTENAVKKFQRAKGLSADGVAGPSTLRAINGSKDMDNSSSSGDYKTEKLIWCNDC